MIQLQAEAIGIHLLQKETTWETYEQDFKDAVKSLIPKGIKGMVFGDLYLKSTKNGQKTYVVSLELRVCSLQWTTWQS